MVEFTGYYLFT